MEGSMAAVCGHTPPTVLTEASKKTPESGAESNSNTNSNLNGCNNGERPKRKMKTPYQLQVLEETFAVENYPSETLRAEVSAKIGLSDRQLQMWFCHRRLKDRKPSPTTKRGKIEEKSPPICLPAPPTQHIVSTIESSSTKKPYPGGRQVTGRPGIAASSNLEADVRIGNMYYDHMGMNIMERPQLSVIERRVVASVEAQLGEPLREDGPILGVEFEPLPPGAFGAPIVATPCQKQPMRPYSAILYEKHDAVMTSNFVSSRENCYIPSSSSGKRKSLPFGNTHAVTPHTVTPHMVTNASSRDVHEYQFLPEQPSIKSELHERPSHTHLYDTSVITPNTCFSYLHGNEQVSPVYNFQVQPQHTSIVSNQRKPSKDPVTNNASDVQFGVHQVLGSENMHLPSDKRAFEDEDSSRVEKRRKTEEARIQKEVEAHEKRIRKELEKQDILRKKREEHMRREMERLDRDRKKEEERLLREKQREEERFLREQRRENERREKILQKESRRVEKMRQKELLRKEKEAARLKAANERATARKLAKEYTELIEDERIELMELAAASKGLNSIISLDIETLEQLDMFRGMLAEFPPTSIKLKRPFATLPWTESEENVANLLMVWKFLSTFIDVFGLTAFSIDEFVQALHDYDSKLLGDIHITLLRSIIKDIEDVARTPSTAFGVNQNNAANPGGGHPQIVEGAYAWGFDIRSWQRHLNILTWPEILRQFALSAGFGPQLKKRTAERLYLRDDNEGYNGEDIISRLRNGMAAENAVALMHERGYSNRRRSRHRLTPGTVKFAAFHVLLFEGSRGLTILEVAEKIQKSGLRDLRTSKTPEASIAAALSRDTKLFERTAPSTYCVKSPFRKDPVDADAILTAAREKVQAFQNGLSDSDGAEKELEDADDAEREDDSECEDPEVDVNVNKNVASLNALKSTENETPIIADKITGKSNLTTHDIMTNSPAPIDVDVENTEIDELNFGELWVQGLTEGEYSDLSVEERLNALVALIGVAIEGNSIHMILEERLEAANTLKKQLWADAQMDKRRCKDEYTCKVPYSSYNGSAHDASHNEDGAGYQVHVNNDQVLDLQHQNNMSAERSLLAQGPLSVNQDSVAVQQQGYALEKSQIKSFISHKAEQLYVYRSLPLGQDRRHNRYWLFSTSTSPNETSSGRIFLESKDGTWRLIDSEESFDALLIALDTRGKRESHLHSMLERIEPTFKEAIRRSRKLVSQSNPNHSTPNPHTELDNPSITPESVENSAFFKIETGRNEKERNALSRRYKMLLTWTWKECYSASVLCAMKYGKRRCTELLQACYSCCRCYFAEEKHCPSCHKTFKPSDNFEASYSEHVAHCEVSPDWIYDVPMPLGFGSQLIKAQLSLIEASIPAEALQPFWTDQRKLWGVKLHSSIYTKELLQLITQLESAIKRDWLSPNYETTQEWLELSSLGSVEEKNASDPGSIPQIPWFANTIAAVALRLLDFDASISYVPERKLEFKGDESSNTINLKSRLTMDKNIQDPEHIRSVEPFDCQKESKFLDSGGFGRRGRGRGTRGRGVGRGRGRGGRGTRGIISNASTTFGEGSYERATRKYRTRGSGGAGGRPRGRGRRGRRPAGLLQIPECQVPIPKARKLHDFSNVKHSTLEESPMSSGDNEWALRPRNSSYVENEENSSGSPQYDENGLMLGYEYDDHNVNDYIGRYSDRQLEPMGILDDDSEEEEEVDDQYAGHRPVMMDVDEDDDDDEDDEDDVDRMDMGGYVNELSSSEYSG